MEKKIKESICLQKALMNSVPQVTGISSALQMHNDHGTCGTV